MHIIIAQIIINQSQMNNLSAGRDIVRGDASTQPLIWIKQASVAIYSDKIIQYNKRKQKSISAVNTTVFSINDLESNDKVIPFVNNDIAFKIKENYKRVSIVKIGNQKIELEFQVQKLSQLIIVQQILRRRLCELGFQQKFKKVKELGKGATAQVYLVQRISDQKLFAAKVTSLKQSQNKEYDTFVNQTKILKCLKNPYIVSIQSLFISKKQLISILQYLSGGTLLQQLKSDLINTERKKYKAIKDITEAVEHLRQKRIVHRDIKLQNIMIRINSDGSKTYVLTDFGLACWMGEKELLYQKCGTPGYIAPEILNAGKGKVVVSHATDIFSLGVIFHFIFLLKAVFPYNGNPKELLLMNKKAVFSLQTKAHMRLLQTELELLKCTLQLQQAKRVTSKDILDIYIPKYEKQVIAMQKKLKKTGLYSDGSILNSQGKIQTAHKGKLHTSNSIQMIQKRVPSLQKTNFSNTKKKQKSQQKQQKRAGSLQKIANYIKKLTSSSQKLKKKQQPSERKKQLKDFIK